MKANNTYLDKCCCKKAREWVVVVVVASRRLALSQNKAQISAAFEKKGTTKKKKSESKKGEKKKKEQKKQERNKRKRRREKRKGRARGFTLAFLHSLACLHQMRFGLCVDLLGERSFLLLFFPSLWFVCAFVVCCLFLVENVGVLQNPRL